MEADLLRYYGIDYRDRWRRDEAGDPRLTLRRLAVLVQHLPHDSATATALNGGEPEWSRLEVLVADVWSAWTGKEHPRLGDARKKSKGKRLMSADRIRKIASARKRARDRKRRIESGEIT